MTVNMMPASSGAHATVSSEIGLPKKLEEA
jgi:hypothetical protein